MSGMTARRAVVHSDRSRSATMRAASGWGLRWGLGLSLPVWFALFFVVLY